MKVVYVVFPGSDIQLVPNVKTCSARWIDRLVSSDGLDTEMAAQFMRRHLSIKTIEQPLYFSRKAIADGTDLKFIDDTTASVATKIRNCAELRRVQAQVRFGLTELIRDMTREREKVAVICLPRFCGELIVPDSNAWNVPFGVPPGSCIELAVHEDQPTNVIYYAGDITPAQKTARITPARYLHVPQAAGF